MQAQYIDKDEIIGGCARLPISIDAEKLQSQISSMKSEHWGTTGARIGVHTQVEAVFLRGHAPAEGDKPIIDRQALDEVPYVREIIQDIIPAAVQRCVIANLKPQGHVRLHADEGEYFFRHIRLHFPVFTNKKVVMYVNRRSYRMLPGEVWALNNNSDHGVMNRSATENRIHIIADFIPSKELLELLADSSKGLGVQDDATFRQLKEFRRRQLSSQAE